MHLRNLLFAALVLSMVAFAQNPATADSPFKVRYAANLQFGESYIDLSNSGANGAPLLGPGFGAQAGNLCVNVYTFSPDEQLISCCSCWVTPNALWSLGVNRDLTSKTLTGVIPTSVVVKLLATLAGKDGTGAAATCNNSAAQAGTTNFPVAPAGLLAWGTTLHVAPAGPQTDGLAPVATFATTETSFTPATLSTGELASIVGRCASIIGNGSGFGICGSCRNFGLGANKM